MKLIKAVVRPVLVDQVIHVLEKIAVHCMSAIDVRCMGEEVGVAECEVSVEYGTTYNNMVKLEIICRDEKVATVIKIIKKED